MSGNLWKHKVLNPAVQPKDEEIIPNARLSPSVF